jgi:apolipoprotein N-acyltransferase
MSGFPWLFVGHAFYRQLWLIQISDLTGAYGVTFLAVMVNGLLATWLGARRAADSGPARRPRQLWIGAATPLLLLMAAGGYSAYCLSQASFTPGPRVAVVQEDFPLVSTPPYGDPREVSFARYMALAAAAAATQPDLLVFPETAWNSRQNIGFLEGQGAAPADTGALGRTYGKLCHEATSAFARGDYATVNAIIARLEAWLPKRRLPRLPAAGGPPVTVVIGSIAVETFPEATYPKVKVYNSALVYDRNGEQRLERYDKNHLVPFGEVVPFRYGRLHWLYQYLNQLSPFSDGGKYEYSLTPGGGLTVFELPLAGRTWRFGTPICYEDVMPYVIRDYVWDGARRRVDFLVNMSNDGWFQYSPELPQHLAICTFRAVENRVGFARAVNTGISAFIDPNGRIYSVVEQNGKRYGPGLAGFRSDHVQVDSRASFYGRFGDWFAGACLLGAAALWAAGIWARWLTAMWRWLTRRLTRGTA